MISTRLLALPLPHLLVSWHKQCKGTRATSRWSPGGYIPPLDAKPLDAESRVMHVRLQFPSRSLGLMIHEALLFPSHIFYPLGTLCTGHGFGVYMPPRGRHPRVQVRLQAPARLNLHLATPFLTQACSFWKLGSQWDRDPMAMCPPSHLLTKMYALPSVTMSSL